MTGQQQRNDESVRIHCVFVLQASDLDHLPSTLGWRQDTFKRVSAGHASKLTGTETGSRHTSYSRMNHAAFFCKGMTADNGCSADRLSNSHLSVSSKWQTLGMAVWGAIAKRHQTDLITMRQNLTAVQYNEQVLRPHIFLFFQQHGPALTSRCDNTSLLPTPANSANLLTACLATANINAMNPWPAFLLT